MNQPVVARNLAVLFAVALAAPLCPQSIDLDETWTVTVGGRAVTVDPDGGFFIGNVPVIDQFGPDGPGSPPDFLSDSFFRVTATSTAGGSMRRAFSEPFQIRPGVTFQVGELTPDLTLLQSINVAAERSFALVGESTQLTVTGIWQDGLVIDVTPQSQMTVYRTSNPRVATVGAGGLVTARGRGTAFIGAENNGITSVTRIEIASGILRLRISGLVQLPDGALAAGATVRVPAVGLEATARADGSFDLEVQAPLFATISVVVTFESGGERYSRTVEVNVNEQDLEQIDVGSMVLRPVEPPTDVFPQPVFEAGSPTAAAAADLDGDGDVDLVGGGFFTLMAHVLLNTGDGTFAANADYNVGITRELDLGDLDGDGDADMVALPAEVKALFVLANRGDGTFSTPVQHNLLSGVNGFHPVTSSALADVNRDGAVDLVAVDSASDSNSGAGGISVLRNLGDGTFAAPIRQPVTAPFPVTAIALSDLDADGDADLVAGAVQTFEGPARISVFSNQGGGTFAASVEYPLSFTLKSIVVSDLDGDDIPDVAAANTDAAAVLLNLGDGTLAPADRYPTEVDASSIAAGDLDGDGRADLAVANAGSASGSILRSLGGGTFAPQVPYVVGAVPAAVIIDDFDGDGDRDLAVANTANLQVLRNLGGGTLADPYVQYGIASMSIALDDLDGDGKPDLVAAKSAASNNILVLRNLGAGALGGQTEYSAGESPRSIALGDLDGDGDSDLAAANLNSSLNSVSVLQNQGDGTFAARVGYRVGSFPWQVALGDVDGDADLDAAAANFGTGDLSILLNRGDATFEPEVRYVTGAAPLSLAFGDLDGDGDADLAAVIGAPLQALRIFRSRGDGTLDPPFTIPVGAFPQAVALGDLDGDGDVDAAVATGSNDFRNFRPSTVSVLLNIGAVTFDPQVEYAVGYGPLAVAISDLDRDGLADIVATSASSAVTVLRNVGEGAFAPPVLFGTSGALPFSLALGDLDGDGDPDLATAGSGDTLLGRAANVSVLFNQTVR